MTPCTRTYNMYCRYTIIGINLGFCQENVPEIFTSLFYEDVNSWVKDVMETYHESTICETDPDENPFREVNVLQTVL